jgi:hypothetical protein
VETRVWVQSPGQTILEVLEGVDNLGQGTNRQFVGKLGWMVGIYDTGLVLVAG